jgi:ferritin-like metal-binding protein YciE
MREARMREHIDETDRQAQRLEEMLDALGDSPSRLKDATLALAANVAALGRETPTESSVRTTAASEISRPGGGR